MNYILLFLIIFIHTGHLLAESIAGHPQSGPAPPWSQTGKASYYGEEHRGRRTASGPRFNPDLLVAAHRTLPFNTKVKVTNLRNNKFVYAIIVDRGPYRKGRIIDLSKAAAKAIGLTKKNGIARVKLEIISPQQEE